MNPFPDLPNCTDLGEGRRMVETHDTGHCFRVLEPDGKVSVTICVNAPPPTTPAELFDVRLTSSGQEVVDAQGLVVARTTNLAMAKHIKNLLIVYENMKARKPSSGA